MSMTAGATMKPLHPRPAASVSIRNLIFSYVTRPESVVLDEMDLEVNPGEVVALVGASGSGKSTVVKLLTRLYDVPPNTIFFNDQCITTIPVDELRRQIAIVSQEPVLFRGTIRDNVRYGSWDASDDEIDHAVELANVLEFSRSLPQGLNTEVNSATLSGGQRQRVAIARALVKDAPLIVLDEATASLDAQSEHHVQQAMNHIFQQHKTVVSIAHRLSTIRHASKIVVLKQGKIVQQGTFKELALDQGGAFWELMKTQLVDT